MTKVQWPRTLGHWPLVLGHLLLPAFAILRAHVPVRLGQVGDLQVRGVPLDAGVDALGDVAQQADLGQRAGIGEVGPGGLARLAGPDPVLLVRTVDAGERLRRAVWLLSSCLGDDPRAVAVDAAHDRALGPLESAPPSAGIRRPSSSSSGRGGRVPSYQVSFSGGMPWRGPGTGRSRSPRAGGPRPCCRSSWRRCSSAAPSFRAETTGSSVWAPRSPIMPQPKSHQQRHVDG